MHINVIFKDLNRRRPSSFLAQHHQRKLFFSIVSYKKSIDYYKKKHLLREEFLFYLKINMYMYNIVHKPVIKVKDKSIRRRGSKT